MNAEQEFAVAVATEVWGYTLGNDYFGDYYRPAYIHPDHESIEAEYIVEEVDSWTGFGRTVEAMAAKGWVFHTMDMFEAMFHKLGKQDPETFEPEVIKYEATLAKPFGPRELIKATHEAALNAVRAERGSDDT